jgi:hypothetical protein
LNPDLSVVQPVAQSLYKLKAILVVDMGKGYSRIRRECLEIT